MTVPLSSSTSPNVTQRKAVDATFGVDKGLLLQEVPPPPATLNAEGVEWWNYYCELFVKSRILSQMFLTAMKNLCQQHMLQSYLWGVLQKQGVCITEQFYDKLGMPTHCTTKPHPALEAYNKCMTQMNAMLVSLGLTAYSAKVNNIDTSGGVKQAQAASPPPAPKLFQSEVG